MKKYTGILITLLILEFVGTYYYLFYQKSKTNNIKEIVYQLPTPEMFVTLEQKQKNVTTTKLEIKSNIKAGTVTTPKPIPTDNTTWGVSKQIDEHTWTIRVGEDEKLATSEEIIKALNEYRQIHGSQVLTKDEKLTNYANERAIYLNKLKSVDQHKGFNDFMENQDGFNKLGFTALGENISYGYKLNGVHVIEWMYAGDKPHNDNQLNSIWNYVGIGVDGLATCLIFGTGRM